MDRSEKSYCVPDCFHMFLTLYLGQAVTSDQTGSENGAPCTACIFLKSIPILFYKREITVIFNTQLGNDASSLQKKKKNRIIKTS